MSVCVCRKCIYAIPLSSFSPSLVCLSLCLSHSHFLLLYFKSNHPSLQCKACITRAPCECELVCTLWLFTIWLGLHDQSCIMQALEYCVLALWIKKRECWAEQAESTAYYKIYIEMEITTARNVTERWEWPAGILHFAAQQAGTCQGMQGRQQERVRARCSEETVKCQRWYGEIYER